MLQRKHASFTKLINKPIKTHLRHINSKPLTLAGVGCAGRRGCPHTHTGPCSSACTLVRHSRRNHTASADGKAARTSRQNACASAAAERAARLHPRGEGVCGALADCGGGKGKRRTRRGAKGEKGEWIGGEGGKSQWQTKENRGKK